MNPKDSPLRKETDEFMYYQSAIGGIFNVFDAPMGYWCGTRAEGGVLSNARFLADVDEENVTGGVKQKDFFVDNVMADFDALNEWYHDVTDTQSLFVSSLVFDRWHVIKLR